jgi:hypothetical protein
MSPSGESHLQIKLKKYHNLLGGSKIYSCKIKTQQGFRTRLRAQLLKADEMNLIDRLLKFTENIWKEEIVPYQWHKEPVHPIFKKGD